MSIFQDNGHASRTEFVGWCIGLVIEAQIDWHNVWLPRIAMHRLCFFFMTMLLYAAVVCDVSACYSPLWSVIGDFISQLQTGQLSNDSFSTPCRYVQCCSMTQSKTNSFTEI